MRRIAALLALTLLVHAQEVPPPAPADEPRDAEAEWEIAPPPSNPAGEPYTLAMALEPGTAHVLGISMKTNTAGPVDIKMEMGFEMRLEILREERGEFVFEAPFRFTAMKVNGQDMLQNPAFALPDGLKLEGRLDERGQPVQGSIEVKGLPPMMAPMKQQMENQLASSMGFWPTREVRIGESWEIPVGLLRQQMAGLEGAEMTGRAYQVFEGVEQDGGVDCARIRTVMSLRMAGDKVKFTGQPLPPMEADIRLKGSLVTMYGLDGYQRSTDGSVKMWMRMDPGGGPQEMTMTMEVEGTGGPEQMPQEGGQLQEGGQQQEAVPPQEPAPAGG